MHLVGYHICPYVHRVAICLESRNIEHRRSYIDVYGDRPSWFENMSPSKRVPLLEDGGVVLYESLAILEYLAERPGSALLPSDSIARAMCRAVVLRANEVHDRLAAYFSCTDPAAFDRYGQEITEQLSEINDALSREPFGQLSNDELDLKDAVFGALFYLVHALETLYDVRILPKREPLQSWSSHLLRQPAVSCVSVDYRPKLQELIGLTGSVLAARGGEG